MDESFDFATSLRGRYNVSNILAALSAATLLQVPLDQAIASLASIDGVEGRMESYEKDDVRYFVDYAHTEDALEKTLQYLSQAKGA